MFDLGDPVPLSVSVYDATGALANATTVTVTITQPDGVAAGPFTPTNSSTGVYTYSFTPTQAGRHGVRWVATGLNASAYTDAFDVASATPRAIFSLAEGKAHLNQNTTTNDEEVRRFIAACTEFIERKVGVVVRQTMAEVQCPDRSGFVRLDNPIISLTTITGTYGSTVSYDAATVTAASPELAKGKLWLGSSYVTSATLLITYIAGYVVVPDLIRSAAKDYLKWDWQSQRGVIPLPADEVDDLASIPGTIPYKVAQKLESFMPAVVA